MLRTLVTCALAFAIAPAFAAGTATPGTPSPADQAFASAMNRMMMDMHAKPTGNPDRDFATMMIPHHRGAIDMAQVELRYGKDPQLLALARAIVTAQEKEIGEMQDWLKSHPR